jgi:hypothetical protein
MRTTKRITGLLAGAANPSKFVEIAERVIPALAGMTALAFILGLYLSFTSDVDYQQGSTVRIMYVHVPAAWLALLCYTLMTANAVGSLVWRHPLADVAAKVAAPLGAAFTLISLVTGALWGKPMWGTWWVWDARLTSMFILFIMYLGIVAVNRALDEPTPDSHSDHRGFRQHTHHQVFRGLVEHPPSAGERNQVRRTGARHRVPDPIDGDGHGIHGVVFHPLSRLHPQRNLAATDHFTTKTRRTRSGQQGLLKWTISNLFSPLTHSRPW